MCLLMEKQGTGMLVNAQRHVLVLYGYASVGIHLSDKLYSMYSVRSMALRPIAVE